MRKIYVMTDSAGDIPEEKAKELGIRVLPIPISHAGKTYHERVELTNEQFYDLLLGSKEVPSTAHITPDTYFNEYRRAYDAGYEQVLNVTINSLGSSMYDAACLARRNFYEETGVDSARFRIEVVDSKTYTMAYGIAVIRAAEMAEKDVPIEEILDWLSDWFDRLEVLFSVYSLDFVKKSGRVGCAAAFVGELLGLRPMILFLDGVASVIDKVRGERNIISRLLQIADRRSCDVGKYPFLIISGTPRRQAGELERLVKTELPDAHSLGIYSVGASVAINCGPKVVALVYAGRKRAR